MIPKWLNAKRGERNSVRDQVRNLNSRDRSEFGSFEQLEEKRCLAFLGFFDGITLSIEQTTNNGDALIENSTGVWRATDNAGTFTFVNTTNLRVVMVDNTQSRTDIAIEQVLPGNLQVELGTGTRAMNLMGGINEIGGNLTINAGSGLQTVGLATNAGLLVRGNMNIDLGSGFNIIDNQMNQLTIEGNVTIHRVNEFYYALQVGLPGPPVLGGNVLIDNTGHDSFQATLFDMGGGTIERNFTYRGSTNIDRVDIGTLTIVGNVDIALGLGNPFFGDPQLVNFQGSIDGDLTITAGDSNLGNVINLLGAFNGNIIRYTGGDLVDTVTSGIAGTQADVFIDLNGGADTFVLQTEINYLEIDFGNDIGDWFENELILPLTFNYKFFNFHQFDHLYTVLDDVLQMNQLSDTGDIVLGNQGGLSGFDWTTTTAIGGASSTNRTTNLVLTMLPNTMNDVEVDLFNPNIASITMNLGDGDRLIRFTGISNNPLRDIKITAGAGSQHVDLSVNHSLGVATLDINLGTGVDTVTDNIGALIIREDLKLTGVSNFISTGLLSVLRHAIIDNSVDTLPGLFQSNGTFSTGGQFTYIGGSSDDRVIFTGVGGTSIGREAVINLGDSTTGNPQQVVLTGPNVIFNRSLTVTSTNANTLDEFRSVAPTRFLGNLSVNLGGGPNQADMLGVFTGSAVSYTGGSGVDTVNYGMTGNKAVLTVGLGAGDDVFNLLAGSRIATPLTIDFGGGVDTFNNAYGLFDFNANLLNLNGFSHIYVLASGTLTSTQVSDPGNVTIDNNGPSQSIRFITGVTSTIAPVSHMTVNMLNGTTGNVDLALDNALAGNLNVNLANGNRALNLTGTNNSIGGNLQITGGTGDQTVEVAVNNALSVGGFALFNLGTGNDTVDEDSNNITVPGNLDFVGVNTFVNNGTMFVGGNLTVDNSADTGASVFDDDATMTITGDFSYTGGSGRDQVTLNGIGGTSIGGNATIHLGDDTGPGGQEVFLNVPTTSVGGNLTVTSTNSSTADSFIGHAAATIGGNIDINLGGGVNSALIVGVIGGSSVKYTGGSGVDNVTFGTTGSVPSLTVSLGAGADVFTILAGASFAGPLVIDFGAGADTFINGFGVFTFDATLLGLHGFNHNYNLASGTLTSTQVEDIGPITIDNNGVANSIRFIGGGTSSLAPANNLIVNMLNGSGSSLNVDLDTALSGNLSVSLGDGTRALNLTGSNNSIGGNLVVTGGSGAQTVEVAVNNALTVGGNALFNLGTGNDIVDEDGRNITIIGHLDFVGVNVFESSGTMIVGGNLTVNNSGETESSVFNDDGALSVVGNFTYTGGSGRDQVSLDGAVGGTTVIGNVLITLGDNTLGGTQLASLDSAMTSIGGDLTVTSTGTTSPDSFLSNAFTQIDGDIDINLGGGVNDAAILGLFGGAAVLYNGGAGVDNVTYGLTGTPVNPNIKLSTGDDHFTLNAGSAIDTSLRVDFGGGNDTFTNNYGAFDFGASLLNWRNFDRIYDFATDSLNMTQLANTATVTLDNNGTGNAIRLSDGVVTEMTPATNLRLFMMTGTTNNVNVDFDSPLAGDLILQLRSGARDISFTGSSNTIGGLLRIEAADGIQTVHLATTADLNVGLSLVINGRNGSDTVDNGSHDINVGGAMILRGINSFENRNGLTVGGDFTQVVSLENIASRLINTGTFNVNGSVTYLGGGGIDEVKFNSGSANIGGLTYINLGSSNNALARQIVRMTGNFTGQSLLVTSGVSFGGNYFNTDSTTNLAGDVIVNFAGTTSANTALFRGNYTGTYGTFRGGSAKDTVVFGASASGMLFAALVFNGNDVFTVDATTSLMSMFIDFGNGGDTFVNNLSDPLPFPTTILNLP